MNTRQAPNASKTWCWRVHVTVLGPYEIRLIFYQIPFYFF